MKLKTPYEWQGNIDNQLAIFWENFVDCDKRLKIELPFLLQVLNRYPSPCILDSAMGIGCETITLTQKKFNILGNEICSVLKNIAIDKAKETGTDIKTTDVNWLNLAKNFSDNSFDVILLLGNSLCVLRELRDRKEAAKNFGQICKRNGCIIVDERNFSYIMHNREEILSGNFRYSGNVVYCGNEVQGVPIKIDNDCVTFGYVDSTNDKLIGTLDMHPFTPGELSSLFFEAGFSRAEIFSDFKKGFNAEADFFTYVFTQEK